MIPASFEYTRPKSVDEALVALGGGGDSKALSGGQSLIPVLKLRLASPDRVVDLGRIPELRRIEVAGDSGIVLGAGVTHAEIEDSSELAKACPLLGAVAREIGDRQIRNRGTIGGSCAHADPAADWPAAILALDGELVARRVGGGARTIRAADFFRGVMSTALEPGEILVEIRIRARREPERRVAYRKVKQSASGFAVAGVAVVLEFAPDRRVERGAIGITGVADHAYRAAGAEKALAGRILDLHSIRAAAALATDGVTEPLSDIHASGEYRLHLARVHTERALRAASGL